MAPSAQGRCDYVDPSQAVVDVFLPAKMCVVQFCICDLVQHEIEYGQTDRRTDRHLRNLLTYLTILLLASNNFTYCVAENGIPSSYEYLLVGEIPSSGENGIPSSDYFTIVMSCVMQFCICDLVQHEIEYGQTDGRTHRNLLYYKPIGGCAQSGSGVGI